MLTIRTHGEYYFKNDQVKGKRSFEQIVKAPNLEIFEQVSYQSKGTDDQGKIIIEENVFLNIRGMLKRKILPLLLKNKLESFSSVRSVTIDEIISDVPLPELPIQFQSKEQLAKLCREKSYPIDVKTYDNIDDLRTDILEYQADPEMFSITQAKKKQRRMNERIFLEMNGLETQIQSEISTPVLASKNIKSKVSITEM